MKAPSCALSTILGLLCLGLVGCSVTVAEPNVPSRTDATDNRKSEDSKFNKSSNDKDLRDDEKGCLDEENYLHLDHAGCDEVKEDRGRNDDDDENDLEEEDGDADRDDDGDEDDSKDDDEDEDQEDETVEDPVPTPTPAQTPAPTPTPDPNIVEFRITAGTGNGAWNTQATMIMAKVGQTIRFINDDNVRHRLHTNGRPCAHGPNFEPGTTFDCVVSQTFDANAQGPLYDHNNGTSAEVWIQAMPADAAFQLTDDPAPSPEKCDEH